LSNARPTWTTRFSRVSVFTNCANTPVDTESHQAAERLVALLTQRDSAGQVQSAHPHISSEENAAELRACHSTKANTSVCSAPIALMPRHHSLDYPQFRHPPPNLARLRSMPSSAAEPLHGALQMISMMVAGQPYAPRRAVFPLYQTTSWNDIKGVGFYKHH